MWLLNIETRRLECFQGKSIPKYAALSHRWASDEVSFQDVMNGDCHHREGYSKIDGFCERISTDCIPVTHVWIDTCCIDKSSNSELSEAINSMYKWYRQAEVCYAYLADVVKSTVSDLMASSWWTRGWTLQELLAPDNVHFFDQEWKSLGTKLELAELITQGTGIPGDALRHFDSRRSPHSVADRMSWAAQRETTREEDLAYSLLGIFGVYMPLLYGEGARAFLRLQEEILKISEDLTLFAWSIFPKFSISNDYLRDVDSHDFGVFAASPESFGHKDKKFRNLLDVIHHSERRLLEASLSGAGLAINLTLIPYCPKIYLIPLCEVSGLNDGRRVETKEIAAMFVESTEYKDRYRRIAYNGQSLIVGKPETLNLAFGNTKHVVLERTPYHAMGVQPRGKYGFDIFQIEHDILRLFQIDGRDNVDILKRSPTYKSLFLNPGEVGVAGIVRLRRRKLSSIYLHFGFDFHFNPFCLISRPQHRDSGTQEELIVFEATATYATSVHCNIGILQLINLMQADGRKFNFQHHHLELHMGSVALNEMQFVGRDCKIGLDLSAGHLQGYVYHVSIGLAQVDYPWSQLRNQSEESVVSRKSVVWHSESWDHSSVNNLSTQSFFGLKLR